MSSTKNPFLAFLFSMAVLGTTITVRAQESTQDRTQSYRFIVATGDNTHDLGSWSKVTGLDVTWDIAEYRSGGAANVSRPLFFPANTKYGTVKLGRAASSEADLVIVWLRHMAETGDSPTLVITLLDEAGSAVVSWHLDNVLPRKYTVGGLNAKGTDVAIETLVLSHEGLRVVCERDC
jgi:phage tail-like protein